MKTDAGKKSFDVMKWLRETRDRIYEETKDMSFEEKRRWSEEKIRRDPFLAELFDRIPRAVPVKPDHGADAGMGRPGSPPEQKG